MSWGGPFFVIAIITVCTIGWLVNNWIRAKHGYALENEWGGMTEPRMERGDSEARRLAEINARLTDRLETVEDRVKVLERIVTDKGYDLAHQIEALRGDRPGRPGIDGAGIERSGLGRRIELRDTAQN